MKKRWLCLWWMVWVLVAVGCGRDSSVEGIRRSGRLVLITDNNAHCYYTYRGRAMGFEYDLARAFADRLGVDLEVLTPGWDDLLTSLENRRGDLVAASLTMTSSRRALVDFSDPYLSIRQHIVFHRDNTAVRSLEDLAGRTIHVRRGSSYHERLLQLQQAGLAIDVVLHANVPTEELIRQVAEEEIAYTVADSNVARLNRRYYPQIKIGFAIAEEESLGWAVRRGNDALRAEINRFWEGIKGDGTFDKIYQKYYTGVKQFDYVDLIKYHEALSSRLPAYEDLIRREARRHGFDWRLIAATIYQESHFNPRARSHTGVRGLMQLTLDTAAEMGIDDRLDPEASIQGGVKYLADIYARFDDIEEPDRLLFTLASYNVGYGHVRDAQQIARELDLPPDKWSSLKKTLPLLRMRRYYSRTRHGYARGTEPVRFVTRVQTYYDILRNQSRSAS
ncbi:MAG TPA: membrane-bound lytic murein transglycosylase MltF [Desulfosarcina sp.]|nr:membrane-bound lytic murein transglycosylase MltF [Desulfosarcina sp.]